MAPLSFRAGLSGTKSETAKIEPILVDSLASPLALERRRMQNKCINLAKKENNAVVLMLLKYVDSEMERVREGITFCLLEIARRNDGRQAIIDGLSNPGKAVRKGAKIIIPEIWGQHSTPYPTLFEQTYQMIQLNKEKDIGVDDIEVLMDISKSIFLDGEMMKSIHDIGACLEFAKRRYKNSETLKNYISDMLKISPEMHKQSIPLINFEESLKTALKLTKVRVYDYTQELIEQRTLEIEVKDQLRNLGQLVMENIKVRPVVDLASLNIKDERMVAKMRSNLENINTKNMSGNTAKSVEEMHTFLLKDFEWYYDEEVIRRMSEGDRSVSLTIYMIGMAYLKMASTIMPNVSEDIYQKYFRELEGASSVYFVI
ncbi:MAG TPA: hypothetical protein VLH13_05010, partial [Methanomassiliicoccales archaeon]|nr:hypothetical protein [Methanomassiliicoccales archaeon]